MLRHSGESRNPVLSGCRIKPGMTSVLWDCCDSPASPFTRRFEISCRTSFSAQLQSSSLPKSCPFSDAMVSRSAPRPATCSCAALRRYSALQLSHGGTLVLRHAEKLPQSVQQACGQYALARHAGDLAHPDTRLMVTNDLASPAFSQLSSPLSQRSSQRACCGVAIGRACSRMP